MRTITRILLASSGAALAGLAPAVAAAQNDVNPHLPNVLLLLDTSGSMEYLIDPDPTDGLTLITAESPHAPAGAACTLTGNTTVMNRWASLVSVLTGSFQPGVFGCETLQRTENKFINEFTLIPGVSPPVPYDFSYFLPWHRIYAGNCTIGAPGVPPSLINQDWTAWGNNPFDQHIQAGTCASAPATNCCTWSGQNNDGILDDFAGLVRFGVMTLDSFPDPSTGALPGTPSFVDPVGAKKGMWSYFHNWRTANPPASAPATAGQPNVNRPAAGNPAGCNTPSYMEVGARNPSAPPWEGPLTPFGDPNSDTLVGQTNTAIQNQILAMRPYGATPIAGLLDDASEFLFNDIDPNPSNPTIDFGPHNDPFWKAGCRKTFAILLTDGQPNLDLRGATGQCDATGGSPAGSCPYDTPENILTAMRLNPATGNPNQSVTTYVVGFAMSTPTALTQVNGSYTSCQQLTSADCAGLVPGSAVANKLGPCCELQKLALAGGGTGATAFFADNPAQLKQVIAGILSQIVGATTSRTAPAYLVAGAANAQGPQLVANPALSYHFAASFNVTSSSSGPSVVNGGSAPGIWSGNLVRERYACVSGVPTAQTVDKTLGDDYAANLDSGLGPSRQFFTAIGTDVGTSTSVINSDWTIRPWVTTDDGFGVYQTQAPPSPVLTPTSGFPALMATYPAAFGVKQVGDDPNCVNIFGIHAQPTDCVTDLINWEIGITNSLGPSFTPAVSRDPTSPYCTANSATRCSRLGAVYHSTPAVIGPPREYLRDDSYIGYANNPAYANKPLVLYTASTDGQLHAFEVAASVNTDPFTTDHLANNELWSFLPPAVLQHLLPTFNSGGGNLLDGAPVIADVPTVTDLGVTPPVFERYPGSSSFWHRVLVASGGPAGGFYYALDITDPTKPTFLWQISTDANGDPLFGKTTPTPAITSVAITEHGIPRVQVPVAILSGGSGTLQTQNCTPPANPTVTSINPNDANNPSNTSGSIYHLNFNSGQQLPPLRCWGFAGRVNGAGCQGNCGNGQGGKDGAVNGASITIVRLDTGQVLAHFMGLDGHGNTKSGGGSHLNFFDGQPLTAPVTGTPVVYPADTGQVADRAYIGDADGQLWRLDLTGGAPNLWTLTLAWDSYLDVTTPLRESIQTAPVLSRDPVGNMNIIVATGDQNLLTSESNENRVWSLTETPLNHSTSQNWYFRFTPTQYRVTGPMALFNDVLYFSTYKPLSNTGDVCSDGYPTLWAVDYRKPDPSQNNGAPLPRFGTTAPTLSQDGAHGSVIFGVSATETPSCGSTQTTQDPYFGSHTQVTGANPSEYRIMWQTGAGSGLSTGNGVRNESAVQGMQNMTVPPPGQSTRIDSWAALVE